MSRKEKDTNDQEYCFLQEAVQEPHKRKPAGIIKRAVYVIVLAVVFGGTASVTFWKVQDVLEKRDARIYRESLLNDAKETSAGTKQTPRPSTESDMLAAYENYWDRIKNIGEQCNKAIVTVDKAVSLCNDPRAAGLKILLIVSGTDKADILYQSLCGPITPHVPASILQLHNDVTVVADEAALAKFAK